MKHFTIYGREDCGYCIKAIHLCLHHGFSFEFINLTNEGLSKEELSSKIDRPVKTVPQVFLGSTYVGGSDDLEHYFQSAVTE